MLVNRQNFRAHFGWCLLLVAGTIAAIAWYAIFSRGAAEWPGGSSLPGLVCGTLAGAIILFEFLLWPRKTLVRVWRIGRTQTWMRAHVWLGLLAVPLVGVHAWKELGGTLSTLLVVLFGIVIVSGIFGLVLQQILPRVMLDRVPAETIYSQVDRMARQYCDEADELVSAICGVPAADKEVNSASVERGDPVEAAAATTHVTIGAMRSIGAVRGRVWQMQAVVSTVPDSGVLRTAFSSVIRPYLLAGRRSGSALANELQADSFFAGLKGKLPAPAHGAVDQLDGLCDQRRQLDLQVRLHAWLHGWLWVHLPLSVALVLLLFVHIFVALKYW
jgi:hypothetical protein